VELTKSLTGFVAFITSNKWMRAGYGKKLREYFLEHDPIMIIDLGSSVFENATVDTNILFIYNRNYNNEFKAIKLFNDFHEMGDDFSKYVASNSLLLTKINSGPWFIGEGKEQEIKEKIEKVGKPLKLWNISINKGVMTGFNDAFYISKKIYDNIINIYPELTKNIKPLFRGRNIEKYYTPQTYETYVITIGDDFDINKYTEIEKHLKQYKIELEKRAQYIRGDHKWFSIDNCPSGELLTRFDHLKIIYPNMTQVPSFCLDDTGSVSNDKTFIITADKHIEYLCGVLNSKLIDFELRKICSGLGNKGLELRKIFINELPIPAVEDVDKEVVTKIESLVEKIYTGKKKNDPNTFKDLERQIDELVYKLYGLTEDEIKIVEAN